MAEETPLASVHDVVLRFLRGRNDIALHGAQAVNAYVDEPRMTQDVDLLCVQSAALAEELRSEIATQLRLAVRVREVQGGIGYRLYQLQAEKNRHLVDIRTVTELPPVVVLAEVQVISPVELIIAKVQSAHNRRNTPKSFTDLRDLAMLLLQFPDFRSAPEIVGEMLLRRGATPDTLTLWQEITSRPLEAGDEDSEFEY